MLYDETPPESLTWRWLWAHAAKQIVASLVLPAGYEAVTFGYSQGICSRADQSMVLLLHPSGTQRANGDLAITMRGQASLSIARDGRTYPEYLEWVGQQVAAIFAAYLAAAESAPAAGAVGGPIATR